MSKGDIASGDSVAFALIRRDHEEVRDRLAEAATAHDPEQRERMLEALDETVGNHLDLEERVLYPALGRIDAVGSFVERMREQHGHIREALEGLRAVRDDTTAYSRELGVLEARLREHFDDTEQRLFGYARRYLAGDLEMLAVEMESVRNAERGAFGVG